MPIWQRLLITFAAIVVVSYLVGLLISSIFGWTLPSYISGVIGGMAALPVWELLKRFRSQSTKV